jgi:hypothetical protein
MQSLIPRGSVVIKAGVWWGCDLLFRPGSWTTTRIVDNEMPRLIQLVVLIAVEAVLRLLQLQLERIVTPALKSLKEFLSQ